MEEKREQLDLKQFNQSLLDASPSGMAATDCNGTILISNQIAREDLGATHGAPIQTAVPELAGPVSAALKKLHTIKDVRITRHDKAFNARINPIIVQKEVLGLLCIFEDVTLLNSVRQKMGAYQEMSIELDTIINSSHDGFWICDGQGTIIKINPASEQLTGVKGKNCIGKSMQEMVDKGIVDRSVTLEVLESKKKESIIQHTKSGKKLLLTGTPVFDEKGRLFRVVINERDISAIEALKQEIDEKIAVKDKLEEDLLEMQLAELKSKKVIARSHNFKTILKKTAKVGLADSSVLILGESGTGKGMIAELIHQYSHRREKPMIRLNCGSIPASLVESELFGYRRGAFTGADKNKAGRFEIADNGILFLDEIAELPLSSQVKLLRFLEDGYLSRIGETDSKKVNVRIIAATNQNLEKMVSEKTFRQDLYYRLKVIPLHLPPLRERRECILPLVSHYMDAFCRKYKSKGSVSLTRHAANAIENYGYPGNVRELVNICERLVVMRENNRIHYNDLPHSIIGSAEQDTPFMGLHENGRSLREMLETFEKRILEDIIGEHLTQAKAAKALGLNQSTIARKLKKHGLM